MKVALVHMRHAGTGGTERYLNQVAEHLAQRGDQVDIVCRTHEAPPHERVRFVRLHAFAIGAGWRMQAFAHDVERYLHTARYDVVYGLGRTWTQDVVRLGGGCYATWVERTRGVEARGGTAESHAAGANAHGIDADPSAPREWLAAARIKDRLAPAIEARALAPAAYARVVVNSRMVAGDVQQRYGVRDEALALIYNGADLERFRPELRASAGSELRTSLGWSARERVVLFLGTGYARKGLARVIDAFPALVRAQPNARLLVVGYDSARATYERRAAERGIADQARFLGGRRDTETCYAAADLYVLPTRYDPFANTTVEALAAGLPVITTQHNGASELIEPRVHGSVLAGRFVDRDLEAELVHWSVPEHAAEGALRARELAERHSAASKAQASAAVLDAVATAKRARA